MDHQRVSQALRELFERYGAGLVHAENRKKVKAAVCDLLPKSYYPEEYMVLGNAMEADVFWILCTSSAITRASADQAVKQLKKERHMTEEDTVFLLSCIAAAHGGEWDLRQGNPKKTEAECFPSFLTVGRYKGQETSVVIPPEMDGKPVRVIGTRAFAGCGLLTGVTVPESVTEIGPYAFAGCDRLKNIMVPQHTFIDMTAFEGCPNLKIIRYCPAVREDFSVVSGGDAMVADFEYVEYSRYIEISAYTNKNRHAPVVIPSEMEGKPVKRIGDLAFHFCRNLTEVFIPDGVTRIGERAFWSCQSMTGISLPNSVKEIGDCAFDGCSNLSGVALPGMIRRIGYRTFRGCQSLTGIRIPESVTEIGDCAFDGCKGLSSIVIPDRVSHIGYRVFGDCRNLTQVSLPRQTDVNPFAFEDCPKLKITRY